MKILFDVFLTAFAIFGIVAIIAAYLPIIRKKASSKTERIFKLVLILVLVFVIVGISFTLVSSYFDLWNFS